MEVFLLCVVK